MGSTPLINGTSGPYQGLLQQGKAGAYGRNASFNARFFNQSQPQAVAQAHFQLSNDTSQSNNQGFLADVAAYSADDLAAYDGNATGIKDGKLDLIELIHVFKPLTPNIGTAQKIAVQWLQAFDTDGDYVINLPEHIASTLFELNPLAYVSRLQQAGTVQEKPSPLGSVASNTVVDTSHASGNTSTPEFREAKHAYALAQTPVGQVLQPNMAKAVCGQLRASLNLDGWSRWVAQSWP